MATCGALQRQPVAPKGRLPRLEAGWLAAWLADCLAGRVGLDCIGCSMGGTGLYIGRLDVLSERWCLRGGCTDDLLMGGLICSML